MTLALNVTSTKVVNVFGMLYEKRVPVAARETPLTVAFSGMVTAETAQLGPTPLLFAGQGVQVIWTVTVSFSDGSERTAETKYSVLYLNPVRLVEKLKSPDPSSIKDLRIKFLFAPPSWP